MSNDFENSLLKIGLQAAEIADIMNAVPARVRDIIQALNANQIPPLLDSLAYIHVTRNRYVGRGVLLKDCNEIQVELLRQLGLVDVSSWGGKMRHTIVIDTSEEGRIAEGIIRAKIRKLNFKEIRSIIHPIIFWICRDIVVKSKEYILPTTFPNRNMFDYADKPLACRLLNANKLIFTKFKEFADKLVANGLVGLATGFNSNNIWGQEFVFPEETDAILEPLIQGVDISLAAEIESFLKLADERYRALDFLYRYDSQTYQGLGNYQDVENQIISNLRNLGPEIIIAPDTFSKGLGEKVPFIIRDKKAYENALNVFRGTLEDEVNAEMKKICDHSARRTGEAEFEVEKPKLYEEIIEVVGFVCTG